MASIPANTRKTRVPTVAFLAHVDTAPDCSGKDVKPILHRKYNGSVIRFPDNPGLTLDPATSPELRTAIGKDIVTASGTTLLGSDDKSGVAVVMTLVETLLRETRRKHGLIRVSASLPMRRSAGAWTNWICECSERMSPTPSMAVRRGKLLGNIFGRCG